MLKSQLKFPGSPEIPGAAAVKIPQLSRNAGMERGAPEREPPVAYHIVPKISI